MVFFDLNIPFLQEANHPHGSSKDTPKNTRLKLVVKAMELGYSGIAYNRSIKGVMSDSDRCTISLFPLSSLIKLAPTLSSTVRFHRDLLGVPPNSPFRQYTRLTVAVDSSVHASALNSGNPILKTYDLVAVRPLNQIAFDQACKVSEVDLISIDFSQKLPFRLKLPMVKAAIERGIYFEITYSHLLSDVHARRQMLPGAKLLVDWTRGKNLIFSSAAPTANELRGPYDAANLSSLFGLSTERAKAAISRNCRSLIANALRKKQFYKEAIRVERISNDKLLDSKGAWFGDWHSWDPISSGEGDLTLDDIASSFFAAGKLPKNSNKVEVDQTPLNDRNFSSGPNILSMDTTPFFFAPHRLVIPTATSETPKQSNGLSGFPVADGMSLAGTPLEDRTGREPDLVSPNDAKTFFSDANELESRVSCIEVPTDSNGLDGTPGMPLDDTPIEHPSSVGEGHLVLLDDTLTLSDSARMSLPGQPSNNCFSSSEGNLVSLDETVTLLSVAKVLGLSEACNDDTTGPNGLDVGLDACDLPMEEILAEKEEHEQRDVALAACDVPLEEDFAKKELLAHSDVEVPFADDTPMKAFGQIKEQDQDEIFVANDVPQEEALVEMKEPKQGEGCVATSGPILHRAKPGKAAHKRRLPHQAFPFPFKGLFNPVLLNKKPRRSKR
ncbi:uncharacterized protein LOC143848160 [Tasmannia lanceolata]|uniref:uncharacterized protein LOC143848160 n=1 Tax=Tasmannia lanceolata TaxID=3420 RepID=UPI004062EDE7